MKPLSGKNAIVTGSTSGIGLGIAEALADAGCNVMINGLRNPALIEEACSRLRERAGIESIYSSADMTKPDQIVEMVEDAEDRFGQVDIMVNNAGIQHVAPIDEFPVEKWDAILAINLSSSFHTMRAVLPAMKKRGWGRIVNIASAHALVASPYKAAYVAAKHGIAGLTKTAALEVAEEGITVNAIAPGYVLTPLVEKQIPDTAEARGMTEDEVIRDVILEAQPTKKFVTVEDVAALAVYLCGDNAASINGTMLPIEGGWTAQ